jgi:hypothetical protein
LSGHCPLISLATFGYTGYTANTLAFTAEVFLNPKKAYDKDFCNYSGPAT